MPSPPTNASIYVPPEILETIFNFVDFADRNPRSLIDVASVCRRWRDIVYSSPGFWTTLHIPPPTLAIPPPQDKSSDKGLAEYMDLWFSRAGDFPLTLHLAMRADERPPQSLIHYIVHNQRWRSLTFRTVCIPQHYRPLRTLFWMEELLAAAAILSEELGHGCWRMLQSFTIESTSSVMVSPFQFVQVAPLLKDVNLTLHSFSNGAFINEPFVDMKNLHSLSLVGYVNQITSGIASRLYYGIIQGGVRLVSLKIPGHICEISATSSMPAPVVPVTNTVLSCLHLHDCPNIRRLLMNIVLPALSELQICRVDDCIDAAPHTIKMGDTIRCLVERSQCTLRRLRLGRLPIDKENLIHVLESLTSLHDVSISHEAVENAAPPLPNGIPFIQQMTVRQNQAYFLPALVHFSFGDTSIRALTSSQLVNAFRQFVEDPRRRCDASILQWDPASRSLREVEPAGESNELRNRPLDTGLYSPLETTHLFVGRNETCVYSRVMKSWTSIDAPFGRCGGE